MTAFEHLVVALAESVPSRAGGPADSIAVQVTDLRLDLPLEARFDDAGLLATLPRGLLATGFDHPLDRVRLTFVLGGSAA